MSFGAFHGSLEMMSAKDARAKSLASINTKLSGAINDIAVLINKKTTEGLVEFSYNITPLSKLEINAIEEKLKNLGYSVEAVYYQADRPGEMDSHHLKISW